MTIYKVQKFVLIYAYGHSVMRTALNHMFGDDLLLILFILFAHTGLE